MHEDSFLDSYWEDQYELSQYGYDGYTYLGDVIEYDGYDDYDDYDDDYEA